MITFLILISVYLCGAAISSLIIMWLNSYPTEDPDIPYSDCWWSWIFILTVIVARIICIFTKNRH